MDISKPVSYRGLDLNDAALQTGRQLRGIAIENVDYSAVDVTGYTEKRAAADGLHASDVYLGGRIVEISGHTYATSLAEMFDYMHRLRAVSSPTSAYQEAPGDRGFLPLYFQQQTTDWSSFPALPGPTPPAAPAGYVPMYMNVRPMAPVRFAIGRDRQDQQGKNKRPVAVPWSMRLLAKDPRVYIDPDQTAPINGASGAGGSGQAINRGDYETPLNIILITGTVAVAGSFHLTGLNALDMYIDVVPGPPSVYRWFGDDRVLMTQAGLDNTAPLVLRMDLVRFATKQRRPMVPANINPAPAARPFKTPFAYFRSVTLAAGSRLFWSEAFA